MSAPVLGPIWAVIRREYLIRVKSKAFLFATTLGPILMAALIFGPIYFAERGEDSERELALADETGVLADRVIPRMEEGGYAVREEPWSEQIEVELTQKVDEGEFAGFIILDNETLQTGSASLYTTARPSTMRRMLLQTTITRSALEATLDVDGVDVEALLAGGNLRIELLDETRTQEEAPEFTIGFMGSMMLYMAILLWAVAVMRATLEEKTSRIAEIIVSAMKPWHMMLGKIVGVGAVGMTQMVIWGASLALLLVFALPAIVAARPELAALEDVPAMLPGAGAIALFVGYFLFGFFIFAGLYAGVGAMCNSDEEVQQAQIPVLFLIITPILFLTPVVKDPSGTLATVLSLFPFFSPILMWPRISVAAAPAWQIVLSFVLMSGTIIGVAWLAGRIYKVGMLMTGKRPTLPELLRWVREA